ncbi:MAG: quinolinate synthase NadA [Ignavibacterium album]|jgi:quinolinate synthase|uniref:quinolinate synthase NadA n=1 Tax=Ignavibacterium album TaxID=591197 RepID=UPI0026EE8E24|nr:quinolinate synthase NadA [Ignavibacterium album]MCX8106031.1 quinolinate synthase NadA [Ignavibacterium album]
MNGLSVKTECDVKEEILKLKKELNAVILAHYYQESEIQDIADFVGDSLELARKAKATNADVIVFAGVHFMAETAKILNPNKLVLIPDLEASCSLAEGCPADEFRKFREAHPDHIAITYINCTAEVKALSDIICTSSNAEKIINQIPPDKPILFSPDRNLGKYLIKKTGREMLLWEGSCIVHETFSERKILELKIKHPDAKLIAHPECEEPVLMHADFIGSTSKLLKFIQEDSAQSYIVATETGIIHQMKKAMPGKVFIPAPPQDESCSCNECPYMKLNTMEKVYLCMKNKFPEINLDEELRLKALKPIERMLEMS